MSTLGQKPATQHVSLQKQTITGNGGTSYTLQQSVGSALDIAVFVNNTRQEPTTAYSASGTTLTMTGVVNSSDHFYVIFLGKAITTTGLPIDTVGTANINELAITNSKIANSTIDLTSKVTGVLPAANSQTNTPAFQARRSSNFNFSEITVTKVTGLTEDFDTDNNFASDRFTPTTAGKYAVTIAASMQGVNNYDMYNGDLYLFKNGSQHIKISAQGNASNRTHRYALSQTAIVDMNGSTDYLEMLCYLDTQGTDDGKLVGNTISFSAFKLIGI